MRTRHLEHMRPGEIENEQTKTSIVYLPIGPLEWHGPHNPLGLDALHAQRVAEKIAERTGGVVMPTLFLGTERERNKDILEKIGFENTDQYIVGMDYPQNTMPSQYAREEVLAIVVREYIRMLQKQGFRMIVLVNGHAADGQIEVLDRLAIEFTNETMGIVKHLVCFKVLEEWQVDLGHATKLETSIMMEIQPQDVDLKELPDKEKMPEIPNTLYGLTDAATFAGKGNKSHTIIYDPRDAVPEIGKLHIEAAAEFYSNEIREIYKNVPNA